MLKPSGRQALEYVTSAGRVQEEELGGRRNAAYESRGSFGKRAFQSVSSLTSLSRCVCQVFTAVEATCIAHVYPGWPFPFWKGSSYFQQTYFKLHPSVRNQEVCTALRCVFQIPGIPYPNRNKRSYVFCFSETLPYSLGEIC